MPSRRSFVCGAVLLLACTALAAHAADAPAAAKPAADAAAAAKPAAAAAAAAAKPAKAAPAAKASSSDSSKRGSSGAKYAEGAEEDVIHTKDRYAKYEEGSGSDKGVKPRWKYLAPTIDATCINPGLTCPDGICDRVQITCAPGSFCTPICNGCQATCAAPLTCTGVKCPKYFQCEVDDVDLFVRCVPATSSVPTTCALGYVRVAATGACVRPSVFKVQGGNILSIASPFDSGAERIERPKANEVSVSQAAKAEVEAEDAAEAARDSMQLPAPNAREPSRKQVEEGGAKRASKKSE